MKAQEKPILLRDRDDIESIEERRADRTAFDSLKISGGTSKNGGMRSSPGLAKLKNAIRNSSVSRSGGSSRGQGRGVSTAASGDGRQHLQRCAVRAQYTKNVAGKSWAKHADYIERDGTGGQAFDANLDEGVDIAERVGLWQESQDEHMFRLIISPEFGDRTDLKKLTRETIAEIEKDLGTKLEWAAVCHFDTDNPHVHLALRGRDEDGNTLRINPSYLKLGLRTRAQEATTKQLGFRQQKDIDLAYQRQVSQQRFTDLDRGIARKLDADRRIHFSNELPRDPDQASLRLKQIGRLAELEKLGLAKRQGHLSWYVDPSIETALKARQQAQDIQKSLNKSRGLITDPHAQLERVSFTKPGQLIVGKMVGSGWDEKTGRGYILIESPNRKLYYLDQTKEIEAARAHLKPGKWVSIEAVEATNSQHRKFELIVTPGDRELSDQVLDAAILASVQEHERAVFRAASKEALQEAVAQQADARKLLEGNIALAKEVQRLTPSALDKSLVEMADSKGVVKFSKTLPKSKFEVDQRMRQIQRLAELEKLGLAKKTGNLAWQIDANLEAGLTQRLKALNVGDRPVYAGRPLTQIERRIVEGLDKNGKISFPKELPRSPDVKAQRLQMIQRLSELEKMGLAQRTGALSWKVSPDLQIALALKEQAQDRGKLGELASQIKEVVQEVKGAAKEGLHNSAEGVKAAAHEAATGKQTKFAKVTVAQETAMPAKGQGADLVQPGRAPEPKAPSQAVGAIKPKEVQPQMTVAAEFAKTAAARTEELLKSGVLERSEAGLKVAPQAQEKLLALIAAKEGLSLQPRDESKETLGVVIGRRGEFALVKEVHSGQVFAQKSKSLDQGDVLKLTKGPEPKITVIKPAKLHDLVHEVKVNRLDLMIKSAKASGMPSEMKAAIEQRREFWKAQGVEVGQREWIRAAHAKAQELQKRREVLQEIERRKQQQLAQSRRKQQEISR